jgi:hypothetical protein
MPVQAEKGEKNVRRLRGRVARSQSIGTKLTPDDPRRVCVCASGGQSRVYLVDRRLLTQKSWGEQSDRGPWHTLGLRSLIQQSIGNGGDIAYGSLSACCRSRRPAAKAGSSRVPQALRRFEVNGFQAEERGPQERRVKDTTTIGIPAPIDRRRMDRCQRIRRKSQAPTRSMVEERRPESLGSLYRVAGTNDCHERQNPARSSRSGKKVES